ncbi:MAG: diacylglycerol kinase family protein [Sphingobacteriales bacterium]|nr:MAG: diacylglycerol kinase family protein [Sphingobacteriales bacterium]
MALIKFSIISRLKSFTFAINGLKVFFKQEHNARIHLFVAVLVIFMAFVFKISNLEWVALIIVIGLVFALEIVNTAIEGICDFISPQKNHQIKIIKDLAAAAVLVISIIAVFVGLIIFMPHILGLKF